MSIPTKIITVDREEQNGILSSAISNTLEKDGTLINRIERNFFVTDSAVYEIKDIQRFNYSQKCTLQEQRAFSHKINKKYTHEWNANQFENFGFN